MTYEVEIRVGTVVIKRQMKTAEMKTKTKQQHIVIVGWTKNQQKSEKSEVEESTKVRGLLPWIRIKRRKWKEHVIKITDTRLVKMVHHKKINGTKPPPRRPSKRCCDSWSSSNNKNKKQDLNINGLTKRVDLGFLYATKLF